MKLSKTLFSVGAISALSTGFLSSFVKIPLSAVYAQETIPLTQVVVCNSRQDKENMSFLLDGKPQSVTPGKCSTFSGGNAFLMYFEYGRNPRYRFRKALEGGKMYNVKYESGKFTVDEVQFINAPQ
jgi:hypothetical protein